METVDLGDKEGVQLPVERTFPPELQTHFVQSITVTHTPEHFVVSYYEIWPPIVLADSEDDRRELYKNIGSIEAKCVSRVVLTPRVMKEFLESMAENFDKYESKYGNL